MADASALAGLLDRAGHVFGLARELGWEFEQEFKSRGNVLMITEESPRKRHRAKINEFIAAVQGMRDEIQNPPEGFTDVADVLRRAAQTAMLMATSQHWEPLESWPYLNQHAHDGYEAVKASRHAERLDNPWAFLEAPNTVEPPTPVNADAVIPTPNEILAKIQKARDLLRHPKPSDSPNRVAADAHNDYATIARMLDKRGMASPPMPDHRLHPLQTINYVLLKLDDVELALNRSVPNPESESRNPMPDPVGSFTAAASATMLGGDSGGSLGNAPQSAAYTSLTNPLAPAETSTTMESLPAVSQPTLPKRRGRRKADYETVQRESQLVSDWEQARASGVYKPEFARQQGMTAAKFDALLDRVAARNRRSNK